MRQSRIWGKVYFNADPFKMTYILLFISKNQVRITNGDNAGCLVFVLCLLWAGGWGVPQGTKLVQKEFDKIYAN